MECYIMCVCCAKRQANGEIRRWLAISIHWVLTMDIHPWRSIISNEYKTKCIIVWAIHDARQCSPLSRSMFSCSYQNGQFRMRCAGFYGRYVYSAWKKQLTIEPMAAANFLAQYLQHLWLYEYGDVMNWWELWSSSRIIKSQLNTGRMATGGIVIRRPR